MFRYPELSKLPKAKAFKSVNFRRQTPGSPVNLMSPRPSTENILDRTHPASNASFNSFPSFRSNELGIRAYPMALLDKPDVMWQVQSCPFDNWRDRVGRAKRMNDDVVSAWDLQTVAPMILNNPRRDRISMSFLGMNAKKRTSSKKHIRLRIVKKIKTAINLIVVRGVDVTELKGRPALVFNQHNDQREWILQGWSYIFFPTLPIYQMPYHELIPKLHSALRFIWERGSTMEKRWAAQISLPGVKHPLSMIDRSLPTATLDVTRQNALADRIPRKAPALFSQEDAPVDPRNWRITLNEEANSGSEDWKIPDIDKEEDTSTSTNPAEDKVHKPPRLLFPSPPQPDHKDLQWPLAPASPDQAGVELWRFSDAPSATTEAEDAWARRYPTSVRDMAKRKLFRRQAVFQPPPEPKRPGKE